MNLRLIESTYVNFTSLCYKSTTCPAKTHVCVTTQHFNETNSILLASRIIQFFYTCAWRLIIACKQTYLWLLFLLYRGVRQRWHKGTQIGTRVSQTGDSNIS